ncbi:hypothetical protein FQA39_LY17988 [Lamprigera yunnana]|nr:hypothetical protein FQA39_LY17988 [Lamprigera yunnana]
MKYLCLLLLVTGIFRVNAKNSTDVKRAVLSPAFSECMCATGVDASLVQMWLEKQQFADNPCFKCFLSCVSFTVGFRDSTSKSNPTIVAEKYGIPLESVLNCSKNAFNTTDPCEKSFHGAQCIEALLQQIYD